MTGAAERVRQHRKRMVEGLVHVAFWTDEADLTAMLIAGRYLDRNRADDREAISEAVRKLVDNLAVLDVRPCP